MAGCSWDTWRNKHWVYLPVSQCFPVVCKLTGKGWLCRDTGQVSQEHPAMQRVFRNFMRFLLTCLLGSPFAFLNGSRPSATMSGGYFICVLACSPLPCLLQNHRRLCLSCVCHRGRGLRHSEFPIVDIIGSVCCKVECSCLKPKMLNPAAEGWDSGRVFVRAQVLMSFPT